MSASTAEPALKQPVLSRVDVWIAAGLGLLALAAYTRTLLPGLLPGDGGEFQALAYTLDHAHTTGYPVYLVLAKLFTYLPVGDVAYRVNLFSAVMAGLTVAFSYLAGMALSGNRWGSGLAAAALAVSSTFWSQSVIAEVYTTGSAFTAAILWLALAGFMHLLLRRRNLMLFFAVGLVSHLFYTLNYGIGDIYVFFISLYVPILVLAAESVAWLLSAFERLSGGQARILRPITGAALVVLALLPSAGARFDALAAGEIRFDFMGLPPNAELADWRAIIRANTAALPQDAVLLAGWNDLYAYIYTAQVETGRADILCIEAHPYSIRPEPSQTILDFVEEQLNQGRPLVSLDRHDELSRAGFRLTRQSVGYSEMYEIQLP